MQLLTINEASSLAGKSIQTIRRMIKQKKIQVKRQKTPQGFNYLIVKDSLLDFANQATQPDIQDDSDNSMSTREHRQIKPALEELFKTQLEGFNTTIQKLVEQNEKDKSNFFGLIKTFQDRIIQLENQVKLLEAPQSSWWQFWK